MAIKVFFLVAALMVASFVVAEAHDVSGKLEKFSMKIILHNLASRDVTFKLDNLGKYAKDVVVGKNDKWSAIEPLEVSYNYPEMSLVVSVKTNSNVLKQKTLKLDLVRYFKVELKVKKYFVLTAVESWKKQYLFIKLDGNVFLTLKL